MQTCTLENSILYTFSVYSSPVYISSMYTSTPFFYFTKWSSIFFTHTKCKLTFAILFGCITPHINIYILGTILAYCFWMCTKYMVNESIESFWFVVTLMMKLVISIWKMLGRWSIGTPRVTLWPNRKLHGWRRWNVVSNITTTSYNTFIWIFYRKKITKCCST